MLTKDKFKLILYEGYKIRTNDKIKEAIKIQEQLSAEGRKLLQERYELEDKLHELYKIGCSKIPKDDFIEKADYESELDQILCLNELWLKDDEKVKKLISYSKTIPELIEASKLDNLLCDKLFECFIAFLKLNNRIFDDKNELFSIEYKNKMNEYANDGILLYFLETPDLPILHPEITKEDILDSFLENECESFKVMLQNFVNIPNPSPSMSRKIEDIYAMIDNLNMEYYRTTALITFSLIESEYRNCANTLNGYYEAKKELKNIKEKSNRINELLELVYKESFIETWRVIESHYKKMITSKENPIIDRNLLVHGEYYNDKMDITAHDVVKLILLFLNVRYISDYIQNYFDIIKNLQTYGLAYFFRELKNSTK